MAPPIVAVVLAAGRGTRMRSALPKVLHPAAGRPLLAWVIAAARAVPVERVAVVVGHGADEVRASFASEPGIEWVVQTEQRGTGHAVAQAEAVLGSRPARLLVLSGDVPLLRPRTARRLLAAAEGHWGALAVAELAEPSALGRVVTGPGDRLERMVEASDATPAELALTTVNAGLYVLPAPDVFGYLRQVRPTNAQREIYLPDALNLAVARGHALSCVRLEDETEAWGVNTPEELQRVDRRLRERAAAGN